MSQSAEIPDRTRCPLCGNDNACGTQAGKETCWCFSVSIAKSVIESVPEQARGAVCICERCARRKSPEEGAPD